MSFAARLFTQTPGTDVGASFSTSEQAIAYVEKYWFSGNGANWSYAAVKDLATGKVIFFRGGPNSGVSADWAPPQGLPATTIPTPTVVIKTSRETWILYSVVGGGLLIVGLAAYAAHKSSKNGRRRQPSGRRTRNRRELFLPYDSAAA